MSAAAHGGSALQGFRLTLQDSSETVLDPTDAQVTYTRAGVVDFASFGDHDWITPKHATVGDAFEIKVDPTSGSFSSGTTGTWLALSTDRTYTRTTFGMVVANVSIGYLGQSTALITKQVVLEVTL